MRKIKMVVPKGRMFKNICRLLEDSGFKLEINDRHYIPRISDSEIEVKIMKPQNISQLIELGSHDIGFTGFDWIVESGSKVVDILDLELDPVQIVAAIPVEESEKSLRIRRIVVASEYVNISKKFLKKGGYDYLLIRTFGATEAFPPQDADMIIDNSSTGQTLRDHHLKVMASIMTSSTRFITNNDVLKDGWKKEKIEELKMLFQSVLNAKGRVMLEMNVCPEKLEEVVRYLPCMRAPTVSELYNEKGYAVKAAVKKEETRKLIPNLKKIGATDILEYEFKKVIV